LTILRPIPLSDTCDQPRSIAPGLPQQAAIIAANDARLFTFDVPQPFTAVDITVTDPQDLLQLTVFRTCDDNITPGATAPIGAAVGRFDGGAQRVSFDVLNQTGRYFARVMPSPSATAFPVDFSIRVELVPPESGEISTLILLDRQRLERLVGAGAGDLDALARALEQFAAHPHVRGRLVTDFTSATPAIQQAYAAWDADITDPAKANAAATAASAWITESRRDLTRLRYVVLVGDDRVVPHFRVPIVPPEDSGGGHGIGAATGRHIGPGADDGWRSEEVYRRQADLGARTTVGSALNGDYTLSDDVYGARGPVAAQGQDVYARDLYVPELAVGRLVEHPRAMTAVLNAFLARDGVVQLDRALTAGYDFMADAARRADDLLGAAGMSPDRRRGLLGDGLTAAALRNALLGTRQDLSFVAAHANHYLVETPAGTMSAAEWASATADLAGTVNLALACHGGLSVPGTDHGPSGQPLDFPEAWLGRGGMLVGTTGWAYGMTGRVAYGEELLSEVVRQLAVGSGTSIGDALVAAKRSYHTAHDLNAMHAKTLAATVLYGLPMYRVRIPADEPARGAEPGTEATVQGAPLESINALVSRRRGVVYRFPGDSMRRVPSPDGDYFEFGAGDVSAEAGEPVQPRHSVTVDEVRQGAAGHASLRGVVLRSATYDTVHDFTPLIPRAVARGAGEPAPPSGSGGFTLSTWHPTTPLSVRQAATSGADGVGGIVGAAQSELIFYLGQYHAGLKREHLFEEIELDEYYSASGDRTLPTIVSVETAAAPGGVRLTVAADDASGMAAVVAAYRRQDGRWESEALLWDRVWSGVLPAGVEFMVQAADEAGNVAVADNGGAYFRAAGGGTGGGVAHLPALWNE